MVRVAAQRWNRPVLGATVFMTLLCFLDTASTLVVVRSGLAQESNPLLSPFLAQSDFQFVLVKGLSFVVPLVLLEILRPRSPKFIEAALKLGVVGYVALYLGGSVLLHLPR